tara:strand:+ start:7201 stop:8916 length:1716 start_codon:yes stop_codon:yes gene_type:complete
MISKLSLLLLYKKKLIFISILLIFLTLIDFVSIGSIPFMIGLMVDENFIGTEILINLFDLDQFNIFQKKEYFIFFILFILLAFLLKFFLIILFHYSNEKLQFEIKENILSKLFKLYFVQNYISFSKRGSAKIIRNLSIEASNSAIYFSNIILLIKELVIIFLFLSYLFYINIKISLISFLIIVLIIFLLYFFFNRRVKLFGKSFVFAKEKLINNVKDNYNSFKEIKIYDLEKVILLDFKKITKKINKIAFKINIYKNLPRAYLELFIIFIILLIFYQFSDTKENFISYIPTLSFLAMVVARLIPSFSVISSVFINLKFYEQSLNHIIFELNDLNENKESFSETIDNKESNNFILDEIDYKIKFENVNFSYSKDKNLFTNFNQLIVKGDKLLISGLSGSGKTTLVNLFIGFIKNYDGKITVNNKDIKNNINVWRKNISYCPQQTILIDDTLIKNITFEDQSENINHDLLNDVYEIVDIHSLINDLPQGEQTILGEFGHQLSGGQKQRIGIARALYKNRNILILDEATNALDENNEKKIINKVLSYYKKKTVIAITHNVYLEKFFNKTIDLKT